MPPTYPCNSKAAAPVTVPPSAPDILAHTVGRALFRQEMTSRLQRPTPTIAYTEPTLLPAMLLGAAVLSALLAAMAILPYTRTIRVTGWLAPAEGISQIRPHLSGNISQVLVTDGDMVSKGQRIAVITPYRNSLSGPTDAATIATLRKQAASLADGRSAIHAEAVAAITALALEHDARLADRKKLQSVLGIQLGFEKLARHRVEMTATLARSGEINGRTLDGDAAALLSARQAILGTKRSQGEVEERLATLVSEEARVRAQEKMQDLALQRESDEILLRIQQADAEAEDVLVAPTAGRVTLQRAMVGEHADSDQPIASVLPMPQNLTALLHVPASSIGQVHPGQKVKLTFDTYPAEEYGRETAKISAIPFLPLDRSGGPSPGLPADQAFFEVTVRLASDRFDYRPGKSVALSPGMTLQASIALGTRSLLAEIQHTVARSFGE